MNNKKGTSLAENILMMSGAVIVIIGGVMFSVGISNNNPNSVGTGAIVMMVGAAILAIGRKFF